LVVTRVLNKISKFLYSLKFYEWRSNWDSDWEALGNFFAFFNK